MAKLSDVDLGLIRIFVTVAKNQGYSAAQTELGMTTSTISNNMKALEQRLGCTLCQRGRVGFRMTAEGKNVLAAAERLLRSIDVFNGEVDSMKGPLSGTLAIGVIDTALNEGHSVLNNALAAYHKRRHSTEVGLYVVDSIDCEKMVLSDELELGIGCLPRKLKGLNYDYLYSEQQELYCSRSHPLFGMPDSEITLDLLSRQRIVSRDLWLRQEIERLTAFKPAALVNNIHAKSFLIRTGHYIGFMPSNSAQDAVDRGDLRSIRPSEYQWSANYYLLTRAGVHRSPAGEAFLEDMRDAIKVSAKTS